MNPLIISAIVAIGLYVVTATRLGMNLSHYSSSDAAHTGKGPIVIGLIAISLHAVFLYQGVMHADGLNLGFFNALSLLGWVIATMLVIGALFEPVLNLGIVMFPGAALTLLLMMIFPDNQPMALQGGWPMKLHVLSSLLAYSLFALAAVQVVLLLMQDKALRKHKPAGFVRALPPLQTMEVLLFQMIGVGFVILTFALLTGAIYITDMFAQHLVHKTVLSIISWLVFGTLLWGRWKFGWRSGKAFAWTMGGFVVLGLAYPVTKFILEVVLNR
jgi:ABC-type uncharacterized transport system permease subunit